MLLPWAPLHFPFSFYCFYAILHKIIITQEEILKNMFQPKIIALDLDGTLFSRNGAITPYTKQQIKAAVNAGIAVIISTGRPFAGLPVQEAKELGIAYAITANGSGIYRIQDKKLLHEESLSSELSEEILRFLGTKHLHMDAFIHGDAFTQSSSLEIVRRSKVLPESVKRYILTTRTQVEHLASYIIENHLPFQKATLNFEQREDGTFIDREETRAFLSARDDVNVVCGGYFNLEFTKAGVSKAQGLRFLCDYLKIPMEASMACGDSENDLDLLKAAGFSVAMENADAEVKSICDYVTSSCEEDGVGRAIAACLNQ